MPVHPLQTPNAIIHISTTSSPSGPSSSQPLPQTSSPRAIPNNPQPSNPKTLVFFITGNPGLIGYYSTFLRLLAQSNLDIASDVRDDDDDDEYENNDDNDEIRERVRNGGGEYVVAGFSLAGFEIPYNTTTMTTVSRVNIRDEDKSRNGSIGEDTRGGDESDSGEKVKDEEIEREREYLYPPSYITNNKNSKSRSSGEVFTLRDQIEICYARLLNLVRRMQSGGDVEDSEEGNDVDDECTGTSDTMRQTRTRMAVPVNVVLIGHSVGAYIALDMTRLHHHKLHNYNRQSSLQKTNQRGIFTIRSTILLTPTILDISLSSSGRIVTPLLSYLPFFPSLVQLLSSGMSLILPRSSLEWVVGRVTGMKRGSEALRATVELLRCPGAVRQALSMAGDEMREIGSNKWGSEVWGVLEPVDGVESVDVARHGDGQMEERVEKWRAPKMYFWFAHDDHWVADVTRNLILEMIRKNEIDSDTNDPIMSSNEVQQHAMRKNSDGQPTVVVDEDGGINHAWCIEHSEVVAAKVRSWIQDVISGDRAQSI